MPEKSGPSHEAHQGNALVLEFSGARYASLRRPAPATTSTARAESSSPVFVFAQTSFSISLERDDSFPSGEFQKIAFHRVEMCFK